MEPQRTGPVSVMGKKQGKAVGSLEFTERAIVMIVNGRRADHGGQAFIVPDANQPIAYETLMMMRNLPLGGTPAERIDAAPAYFESKNKHSGDFIEVSGALQPFGNQQVLEVEQCLN